MSVPALIEKEPAAVDTGALLHAGKIFRQEEFGLTFDYIKSRLFRDDTQRLAFDQNIYRFGCTLQWSRFSFARVRVELQTLLANVRAQILLGWTPSPGTALYLGYNEDLNYRDRNPLTHEFEPGMRRNSRTLFMKLSYPFGMDI